MSFCQVAWSSPALRKQVAMNVILPDVGEPPFPVFYLLHGLSDDHTVWHRRTRIEWYVRNLPLIVVMPDGYRGFYTNHEEGPAYATYMAEDLPAFVERNFPAASERDARCIGGLSMGGYGALRIALGYPDRYVSANSHSGALMFGHRPVEADEGILPLYERLHMLGKNATGSDHDLIALARRIVEKKLPAPALKIDCGTEDFLLEDNRAFVKRVAELGLTREYSEFPGSHSWDYWDLHIREALEFHCAHLGIAPVER